MMSIPYITKKCRLGEQWGFSHVPSVNGLQIAPSICSHPSGKVSTVFYLSVVWNCDSPQ